MRRTTSSGVNGHYPNAKRGNTLPHNTFTSLVALAFFQLSREDDPERAYTLLGRLRGRMQQFPGSAPMLMPSMQGSGVTMGGGWAPSLPMPCTGDNNPAPGSNSGGDNVNDRDVRTLKRKQVSGPQGASR